MSLADALNTTGSEDDDPEPEEPGDPVTESVEGDTILPEGIIAMPLLQQASLAGIVVALLVFVLRRRRRANMMVNEKNVA